MEHVGVFKTLTGGDTVDGEKKFKDRFSFNNTARLIFSTNKPPKVEEDTLAFWRRWIFINLPNKFEGSKADKRLFQKLTKKEELSGLLNIALDGLKRLLNKHEYSYELSPDEIAEWHQKASDPIYAFVEDICEVNPEAWISKDELYDVFIEYCDKQNIPRIGIENFGRALKNAKNVHVVFKRRGPRGAQKTGWLGIQLRERGKEEIDMEV
jgi:putative DNA primase/helicase